MKIALAGSSGRMGKEIAAVALETGHKVVAELSRSGTTGDVSSAEVLIDFSLPAALDMVLATSRKYRLPVVSGVTGYSQEQHQELEKLAREVPLLWSPNMSIGVHTVALLLEQLGQVKGFHFGVEEIHHSRKKDRPSGTALFLANVIRESSGQTDAPEIVSLRGGGVPGIHRIYASAEDEMITIEHSAFHRKCFARGAVTAAEWLSRKRAGTIYEFRDFISGDVTREV